MNTTSPVPDPQQALLFAPGELLAHGLRAAHPYPLVGTRTADGIESCRMPAGERAWTHQLIEWTRAGSSTAGLGFDCDSREAVERAASACMGAGDLPTPNICSTRTASGHAQVFWLLDRPVHRGDQARAKPQQFLGRISEYYRDALGADSGYRGVLASNPVHSDYATSYPRAEPYSLGQLAKAIPKGWRVPQIATTAEGRNWGIYLTLLKFAGKARHSEADIHREADRLYGDIDQHQPHYFSRAELHGIVKSVLGKRAKWRSQGHQQAWLWRQAARGKQGGTASGVVRLARVNGRDRFILARLDAGESQVAIARAFGVHRRTVQTAHARLSRGGAIEANTDKAPSDSLPTLSVQRERETG